MNKTFDQGKDEIVRLCNYFSTNRESFLAAGVKEAHVRQSLIDPMFEALGWDVRNSSMAAPQYREVVPEDSLEIEGQQKAPDYTFRLGTMPKFFVEAKKCGVNLANDPAPAYQLRRYGWSARVPLSLLTDFEELGIYDCSLRPRPEDKPGYARSHYFRFEEYPDRWRELWDSFSREAVWSGAFDRFATSKRTKRGTSEVDDEFLKDLEGWRDVLARNIALRNQFLAVDDLNAAVQRTIDRIIFLRMAEDRGIESYGQLLKLCDQPEIYSRFMNKLCRSADDKYNSGLFHFQKEEEITTPPDKLTPKLTIDDKVFKPILQSLYFEHGSPYHFGVLPVEILGTVYERFLGKVIRLTPAHQAKVEEKPEVRKAGGVYYTPAYIVDYIVSNTVGKMIEGKSPAQLAGGKNGQPLRVLDMACGSGSFLLGAFQCLLDHCLKWYTENKPEKHKEAVYHDDRKDQWRLTIAEKKRILLAHIYGVDLDSQAVEVSKLSLLLKVLEGETDQTVGQTRQLFHERALPDLATNIKCGNSLIGPEYFTGRLIPDIEEMKRINPFDWNREFPEAMKAGGFDCVIGNPPYIRIQTMQESSPEQVEYLKQVYRAAGSGNYDIYVVFVERGLNLLNPCGRLGFILPHKFFNSKYGEPLRGLIAQGRHLAHVVHFGDQQIFEGATTYTCLMILDKSGIESCDLVRVSDLESWQRGEEQNRGEVMAKTVTSVEWNFSKSSDNGLRERLSAISETLGGLGRIFQGLITGADRIYVLENLSEGNSNQVVVRDSKGIERKFERDILKPFLSHVSLGSYEKPEPLHCLIFPYHIAAGQAKLINAEMMASRYPKVWEYLSEYAGELKKRENGKWNHAQWYAFGRSQNLTEMDSPKLVVQVISQTGRYAFDNGGTYFTGGGNGPYYGVRWKDPDNPHSLHYLQGLLNSNLLDWILRGISSPFRGGYWSYGKRFIEQLPIRIIDFSEPKDRSSHDQMVHLVESMLELQKHKIEAKSQRDQEMIQRQIEATDREIDQLVYGLYELSEAEIRVIEGNGDD